MTNPSANVPAAPAATQVSTHVRKVGEVTISRDKLMMMLGKKVPGLSEEVRMPLENEKAITRVVRKATAELVIRGKKPTLAAMLDPKLDIQVTVRYKHDGRWQEKRVSAASQIKRILTNLYGEYMGKGERVSTTVSLPLLNEKSTPAKAPLEEAILNCHQLAGTNLKPLPKVEFAWIGVDDEE
jgi:hypothetical protein